MAMTSLAFASLALLNERVRQKKSIMHVLLYHGEIANVVPEHTEHRRDFKSQQRDGSGIEHTRDSMDVRV